MATLKKEKIAVIGSGIIGQSWAMIFASAGYKVSIYDIVDSQVERALNQTKIQLQTLEEDGLLRGNLTAEEQFSCVSGTTDLKEAISGAFYLQECIPESLDMKKALFEQLDDIIDDEIILASSTSSFIPSLFSENMKHRGNVLVSHPVNPPYFIPLVEIVPSPWTSKEVTTRTRDLMTEIGQKPVLLSREVEGFALNRIQLAILMSCWQLIGDDILSVKDVDSVMKDGLGLRYAFLGPMETTHLNAEGFRSFCERYMKTIAVSFNKSTGANTKIDFSVADKIANELEETCPLEDLEKRRAWRDSCLAKLCQLKKSLDE